MAASPRMEKFRQALRPLRFDPRDDAALEHHRRRLEEIRRGLPPMDGATGAPGGAAPGELLEQRAAGVEKGLTEFLTGQYRELARENLVAAHSYAILFAHTRLMDALHAFAFEVAWEEIAVLARMTLAAGEKEHRFRRTLLPKKQEMLQGLRAQPEVLAQGEGEEESQERAYFRKIEADLEREVAELERVVAEWEGQRSGMETFQPRREAMLEAFVLFARGGYGRCELSFSSDLDTGYCVDPRRLSPGQLRIFQELIVRMETLLRRAGLEPAHQYFEVGEDLSRFGAPETIHAVSSVLEGRALLGNPALLAELQGEFRAFLPYEDFLKNKIGEYEAQRVPPLTEMDLKEDHGGLRTIQTPLWILGATHQAEDFGSAALVELACELGVLSTGDAARYLLALEFLHDLRNFVGFAEPYYQDRDARAALGTIPKVLPNRINDPLARLYVFRKRRFASLDGFDSYRLRLAADIRRISGQLLEKILDRTVTHQLGPARLVVHLGRKRIIRIEPAAGGDPAPVAELFPGGDDLLRLMCYIARSDYDLAEDLKDTLAEAVGRVEPAGEAAASRATLFSELMAAPYAHRALATMWEINDPLAEGWRSLLGGFIPACDGLFYLLREARTLGMPVHQHVIRALRQGQRNLDWLRAEYPEFHALLDAGHVLALKWSLFLHAIGKPQGTGGALAQSAELAAETLSGLGYRNPPLERLVRLLVQHQATVARLHRTATYHDEALVGVFEAAQRDTVHVILLFLVNISILQADGERSEGGASDLRRFFDETGRILAELPGVPDAPRSLDLINLYLDRKKSDLTLETRLHLLVNESMAVGLDKAIYQPLAATAPEVLQRLEPHQAEMETQLRQVVLGAPEDREPSRSAARLFRVLAGTLSEEVVERITAEHADLFSWFMAAFPNRYLLGSSPAALAGQMGTFRDFQTTRVRAAIISGSVGTPEGLLFFTRNLPNAHSRVAYALSRRHINIVSGKVNPVVLGPEDHGFCYYFQISPLASDVVHFPRELENIILNETPRDLVPAAPPQGRPGPAIRIEFLGNDHRGYTISRGKEGFFRGPADFRHVRVTLRDEPFLFYKAAKVFDYFGIEVRQSLITTTGNQVLDYFYLLPEDYEKLRAAGFVEQFNRMMQMGLG